MSLRFRFTLPLVAVGCLLLGAIPGPCTFDSHPELDCGNGAACPEGNTCGADGYCKSSQGSPPADGPASGNSVCDPTTCPAPNHCDAERCVQELCTEVTCPAPAHCEGDRCIASRGCDTASCPPPGHCEADQCIGGAGCDPASCNGAKHCEGDRCVSNCDPATCNGSNQCDVNGECVPIGGGTCSPNNGQGCVNATTCSVIFHQNAAPPSTECVPPAASAGGAFAACTPTLGQNPCADRLFCLRVGEAGICVPFCDAVGPSALCNSFSAGSMCSQTGVPGLRACLPSCDPSATPSTCPAELGVCGVTDDQGGSCDPVLAHCFAPGCTGAGCPQMCGGTVSCPVATTCTQQPAGSHCVTGNVDVCL
jgi:hypothetical protein